MVEKLINEYVSRMTISDIDDFAKKNGISLNGSELELIYGHIKKNYRTIVYGNPRGILDELRSKLEPFTYSKVEELYIHFKNKYNSYL